MHPTPLSADDLRLMELIDRQIFGVPLLRVAPHGGVAGHPGLCRQPQAGAAPDAPDGLVAIYQRPNTSKAAPERTKYPYLLGGLTIDRVNQVWCTDITYIPLAKGFIYLVAIMGWHSRAVLAWRLSNTLHADFCVDALEEALRRFGRPEIFNTDQGGQFTSTDFTGVLKAHGIKISMDGKGRCMDNVFIERLWRSLKYESGTCTPTRRSPKPGRALALGCTFTTRNVFIRRTATGRPGRSTKSNARGHRDDRLRRTVPLPPLPGQDREPAKCSPSPP